MVNGKDVIFGCCSDYEYEQVRPWLASIKTCGFSGDVVMLVYRGSAALISKLEGAGVKVLCIARNKRGDATFDYRRDRLADFIYQGEQHIPGRWYWQWWPKHLNEAIHDVRMYHAGLILPPMFPGARYLVFSDVRDVIFQRDPIEFLESRLTPGVDYVVAEEPHVTSDERWAKRNTIRAYGARLYERVATRPSICIGLVGGRFAAMTELLLALYLQDHLRRLTDQASLNMLLTFEPWRQRTLILPWTASFVVHAATLGADGKPRNKGGVDAAATIKDGLVRTPSGEPYYVVHQYDRHPEWAPQMLSRLA